MKTLKQIGAVTLISLSSVPQRLSTSLVVLVGIGGVVAVLISVMAMATGMVKTLQNTGRTDRVIVLSNGSTSEIGSGLSRDAVQTLLGAPGIKRNAEGQALVSAELVRPLQVRKSIDNTQSSAIFRGVGAHVSEVRPEIKIVAGRMFNRAVNEVIVGKGAKAQFQGLDVGSQFRMGSTTWTVVGIFASGDSHESELLTDTETLLTADRRNMLSSVTVVLDSPASYLPFADFIATNPALFLDAHRESTFYEQQSKTSTRLVTVVAYVIGGIMAVGALFGALNTMYTAVSSRAREIATLRAIGFGAATAVSSVLVEAMLLATVGGLLGAAAAWLFTNGNSLSTSAGVGLPVQIVFDITVNWQLVVVGIVWAAAIGLLGGVLPAVRAARLPIAIALRQV